MLNKAKNANPELIELYLSLSKLYFLAGDYDRGVQELKAIIELSPENIDALSGLAFIFELRGKHKEAHRLYDLASKTGSINGHVALAKYFFRKNDYERGMEVINEAMKSNPHSALLYELKGKALISKNKYADAIETFEEMEKIEDAIETFEEMEKIEPVRGYRNIRDCYLLMNAPEIAIDKAEKELNKNNQRLDVMADISSIYSAMGNRENAIRNANKIIRTNPYSSIGYKVLAKVYLENKDYHNAENVLDEAIKKLEDDVDIYLMKGKLFRLKNDHTSALKVYSDALRISPGHISLIFNKGATFHEMGRTNEAVSEYMKALSISNNHVTSLNNLAYIYAESDSDPTKALYLASKAYLLSPFDADIQDTLGLAMIKNNLFDDALKLLSEAKKRYPKNPAIRYHSALAHKARNEKNKAIEELRIAVELGNFPDSVKAEELLISLLRE
jgi:tetratricopeptide (TPR) repeat protein